MQLVPDWAALDSNEMQQMLKYRRKPSRAACVDNSSPMRNQRLPRLVKSFSGTATAIRPHLRPCATGLQLRSRWISFSFLPSRSERVVEAAKAPADETAPGGG